MCNQTSNNRVDLTLQAGGGREFVCFNCSIVSKKRKKDANYISDVRSSFKNTRSRDSASPRAAGVEDRHSETAGIQTWFIHDAAAFGQTVLWEPGGCWGSLLLGLTPKHQLSLRHRGRVETSSSSLQVELAFTAITKDPRFGSRVLQDVLKGIIHLKNYFSGQRGRWSQPWQALG